MSKIKMLLGRVILFLTICAGAGIARAQVFNYNFGGYGTAGDVLVCFRYVNPSSQALGSYELVVDCGSVATFTNMTAGQTKAITTFYSPSLLSYVGTNNIYWSALACYSSSDGRSAAVWLTRPRSDLNTQTTPWLCKNTSTENQPGGQIDTIGNDAIDISFINNTPAQSATYLVEHLNSSSSDFYSYSTLMGVNQDLAGSFWGDASGNKVLEQGTPSNFTTAGQSVRADFYQLLSTNMIANPTNNQAGTYLGYFELATNGVMTYTAGPSPTVLTAPRIVSFTHTGNTSTIYFTTVSAGSGTYNYTLRGTNSTGLGAATTNWPAIGSSIVGNGLTNSLSETTASSPRFYTITAQSQ
jgi:hypothetical protein